MIIIVESEIFADKIKILKKETLFFDSKIKPMYKKVNFFYNQFENFEEKFKNRKSNNLITNSDLEDIFKNIDDLLNQVEKDKEQVETLFKNLIDKFKIFEILQTNFKLATNNPELNEKLFLNKESNKESKSILLGSEKFKPIVWYGQNYLEKDVEDVPLILNFDGQKFYFYLNNLKVERNGSKNNWLNYGTSLSNSDQKKIIKVISVIKDQKKVDNQIFLLKLKFDYLNKFLQNLKEDLYEQRNFLTLENSWNKEIDYFLNEITSLKRRINYVFTNFNSLVNKINLFEVESQIGNPSRNAPKIKLTFSQEVENYIKKFDNFNQNSFFLSNQIKTFKNKFKQNSIYLKMKENLNNEKEKKMFEENFYKYEKKIVFLKYKQKYRNYCLVWWGFNRKVKYFHEEPLVLNFSGKDFYFYSSGIKIENFAKNRLRSTFIYFKSSLDHFKQYKMILAFTKFTNQNDISNQCALLRMKIDFLNNWIYFLENKMTEKKYSTVLETEFLVKEIVVIRNKLKSLDENANFFDFQFDENYGFNKINEENIERSNKVKNFLKKLNQECNNDFNFLYDRLIEISKELEILVKQNEKKLGNIGELLNIFEFLENQEIINKPGKKNELLEKPENVDESIKVSEMNQQAPNFNEEVEVINLVAQPGNVNESLEFIELSQESGIIDEPIKVSELNQQAPNFNEEVEVINLVAQPENFNKMIQDNQQENSLEDKILIELDDDINDELLELIKNSQNLTGNTLQDSQNIELSLKKRKNNDNDNLEFNPLNQKNELLEEKYLPLKKRRKNELHFDPKLLSKSLDNFQSEPCELEI